MLRSLQVRDFAIVDDVALELGGGMTVLSGETGAGKSLLVDALNLAVGERASQDWIRADAASAEVNAVFDPPPPARQWLEDHGLAEADDSCMLRRVIGRDGRSRAWINGRPAPVSRLKGLGDLLVDVHGQHAHQSLLRPATQRQVLDAFGGHTRTLEAVRSLHAEALQLREDMAALSREDDPLARADYLRFQISEMEPFCEDGRQPQQLLASHRRLAHAADLMASLTQVRERLEEGPGSVDQGLSQAMGELEIAARIDPALQSLAEPLAQARTLVAEVSRAVAGIGEDLDLDPRHLQLLERELGSLQDLARKHRVAMQDLLPRLEQLRQELQGLERARTSLEELARRLQQVQDAYQVQAEALSEARGRTATPLAESVNSVLSELGMAGARVHFEISRPAPAEMGPHGVDSVSLMASTNPGQPALPLARVASGGELSRIALAIQSVSSGVGGTPSVVFDEVDVGVGGAAAEVVGRRMRALARDRQVLTVTHQAQVAALAHTHLRVVKTSSRGRVRTGLERLDGSARVQEVARMLGGVSVTERSLDHAREMLATASQERSARAGRRTRTG